jgi:hypothetical protein
MRKGCGPGHYFFFYCSVCKNTCNKTCRSVQVTWTIPYLFVLLLQGSRQPCLKNVPLRWQKVGSCLSLAVWYVRLLSSNYESNYATCFWTDVIWYTNYNRRKGRLLPCGNLSRYFFDLFLQLPLHFLLFLFLLLLLLTMEPMWITFGHFTVSCVL